MDMYAPCVYTVICAFMYYSIANQDMPFLQYYTTAAQQSEGHICGSGTISIIISYIEKQIYLFLSMFDLQVRHGLSYNNPLYNYVCMCVCIYLCLLRFCA